MVQAPFAIRKTIWLSFNLVIIELKVSNSYLLLTEATSLPGNDLFER